MSEIRSLWVGEVGENPLNANADVLVELEDGRRFAFTAFTPLNLMSLMEREHATHLVVEDLLIVSALTEPNVRGALEEILREHPIERFGVRQKE